MSESGLVVEGEHELLVPQEKCCCESDGDLTAVRLIRPVPAVVVSVAVVDVQDTAAICTLELLHAAGGCHNI